MNQAIGNKMMSVFNPQPYQWFRITESEYFAKIPGYAVLAKVTKSEGQKGKWYWVTKPGYVPEPEISGFADSPEEGMTEVNKHLERCLRRKERQLQIEAIQERMLDNCNETTTLTNADLSYLLNEAVLRAEGK